MKKYFLVTLLIAAFLPSFHIAGNAAAAEDPKDRCNYVLIFQAAEYDSKMGDAVDFFFKKILKPDDHLSILTPLNPYNFPPQTRRAYPIEKLIDRTKDVLKRDISTGQANYQQVLENMMQLVRDISGTGGDLKASLVQYRQQLAIMQGLRKLDENLFMQLAALFKKETGKNYLYIFYQEELRVVPSTNVLQSLRENSQYKADAIELFEQTGSEEFLDVEKVGAALKDAPVTLTLIYLNRARKQRDGMEYKEFSGDVYNVLSKLANATGGFVEATSKPEAALKKSIIPITK